VYKKPLPCHYHLPICDREIYTYYTVFIHFTVNIQHSPCFMPHTVTLNDSQ